MPRYFFALICIAVFFLPAQAQKQQLEFKAEDFGNNRIRIAWKNPFGDYCVQLMVQRSYDSIRNFKTVFATESPQLPENGVIDNLPYNARWFYRIFYVLADNSYYFTVPQRPTVPVKENSETTNSDTRHTNDEATESVNNNKNGINIEKEINKPLNPPPPPPPPRIVTIHLKDTAVKKLVYAEYRIFRDSIAKKTRDTLYTLGEDEYEIHLFDPWSVYVPSKYVVSNDDGYIQLKLPDAAKNNYKIVFYENDGKTKLFTINRITDTLLIIDKTNFMHSGWFKFELYENDKLKEKNKILLQKDF